MRTGKGVPSLPSYPRNSAGTDRFLLAKHTKVDLAKVFAAIVVTGGLGCRGDLGLVVHHDIIIGVHR